MDADARHKEQREATYRQAANTHRRAEALEITAAKLLRLDDPAASERHTAAARRHAELAAADDPRADDVRP